MAVGGMPISTLQGRMQRFHRICTTPACCLFTAVLGVTDLFQPIGVFAIEMLMDGDMRQRRGRRRTMPMFFASRNPHHIAGADFLNRLAPALHTATPFCHHQRLPKWVSVPRRPRCFR